MVSKEKNVIIFFHVYVYHFLFVEQMLTFSYVYDILGESVEENANLVIRLLIRRPECLGPALRGEGEGLLRAIIDANKMSERIADRRKVSPTSPLIFLTNVYDRLKFYNRNWLL